LKSPKKEKKQADKNLKDVQKLFPESQIFCAKSLDISLDLGGKLPSKREILSIKIAKFFFTKLLLILSSFKKLIFLWRKDAVIFTD